MSTSSEAFGQEDKLVEVRVKVMVVPASPGNKGLYVAFNVELLGLKVPKPPDHCPVVVPPVTDPLRSAASP